MFSVLVKQVFSYRYGAFDVFEKKKKKNVLFINYDTKRVTSKTLNGLSYQID
jgi:hypothetical protein